MRFCKGKWNCTQMGIVGRGNTMWKAWDDMWASYAYTYYPLDLHMQPRKPRG